MDGQTDLGRTAEWNEMCEEIVTPTLVTIDGERREIMTVPQGVAMALWHERYPDELWAVYVRPSPHENGVRPVGMTPAFRVITSQTDRFAEENLDALHYGTYDEMITLVQSIVKVNKALSEQFRNENA